MRPPNRYFLKDADRKQLWGFTDKIVPSCEEGEKGRHPSLTFPKCTHSSKNSGNPCELRPPGALARGESSSCSALCHLECPVGYGSLLHSPSPGRPLGHWHTCEDLGKVPGRQPIRGHLGVLLCEVRGGLLCLSGCCAQLPPSRQDACVLALLGHPVPHEGH